MSFPLKDPTKTTEEQGLFLKFIVERTDGSSQPGGKHHGCEYFVLDLDHDKYAKAALVAYAKACQDELPALAADIRAKVELPSAEAPQEFSTSQWWYQELLAEADKSDNFEFKRAVHGVIPLLIQASFKKEEAPVTKTMTLTAGEIGDLAAMAGFSLPPEAWPVDDEKETEFAIAEDHQGFSVTGDNGEKEAYKHVAFLVEYPEEGVFPLGEKL